MEPPHIFTMPKVFPRSAALAAIFLATAITECWSQTTVVINATASHSIPSTLYGMMFEDISSGDGGLYAELLQNRAFQQVNISDQVDALTAWSAIGSNNSIAVIADPSPLSSNLPNSLQLSIPQNSTGSVGFENSGYWGINVNASWTYNASLYYRFPNNSTFSGPLNISLQSSSGAILASASFNISGAQVGTNWTQLNTTFTPTASGPDTNNSFAVTLEGAAASGETLNFALLSLFPPTYKGRANGMRVDIAESMAGLGPSFFRLPGGNNLGQTIDTRWQWNATVGPLIDRSGRVGDWSYVNTDGLGLYEYMTFCEDVGMDAIMAVWGGYALNGESVAQADLQPYIQQAIDQINFVINNDTSSGPAAIRASMGHPEPFNLTYLEVGNEDFFTTTYDYRWTAFLANLTALFPDLKFIATSYPFDPVLTPTPLQYDVHVYQTPTWFADNSFYYDDFERNGTQYFEGEYASTSTNASNLYGTAAEGRFLFPEVQASVSEAAFMTGLERNSDIVFAASYAPLLGHVNDSQWTPNLIGFDAGSVIQSTSYYVQQMFSLNRGDVYLPSTLPSVNGTLYWSVTKKNATNELFIKVANTIATAQNITFKLPFSNVSSAGSVQLLTGSLNASNTPEVPNAVTPSIGELTTNATFEWTAPGYSVAVLTVKAQ